MGSSEDLVARVEKLERQIAEMERAEGSGGLSRREYLGLFGAAGVVGGAAGAGSAGATVALEDRSGPPDEVDSGVYRVAQSGAFVGPDSARANVDHSEGQVYYARDTGARYYDTGSSWVMLPLRAGSADIGRLNSVYWAEEGNLQEKIDEAAAEGGDIFFQGRPAVALKPHERFGDVPYKLRTPVVLFMNGSIIEDFNRDNDILQVEPGTAVVGPGTIRARPDPYTSSALRIDSSEGRFKYGGGGEPFTIHGTLSLITNNEPTPEEIGDTEGNAIHLDATSGDPITHINLGHVQARGFNNTLLAETGPSESDGFLNDVHIMLEGTSGNRYFNHVGESEAKVLMYSSHMQLGNYQFGFRNTTGELSVRFWGHAEDPNLAEDNIVDGENLKIYGTSPLNLDNMPANMGAGTTWNGYGAEPDADGEPTHDANLYFPGERVVTASGLYEKNIYADTKPWIQIASGAGFTP
jgi:hypothetical protein